ncbi:hypothetical protein GQ44DRAFT_112779 [Phaeosphaeriaceae sp. PMI808]|nr:hypothetical protein GQ44DRAFT_112779 [Phaeosphaeriaceae sp. PMI808]
MILRGGRGNETRHKGMASRILAPVFGMSVFAWAKAQQRVQVDRQNQPRRPSKPHARRLGQMLKRVSYSASAGEGTFERAMPILRECVIAVQ